MLNGTMIRSIYDVLWTNFTKEEDLHKANVVHRNVFTLIRVGILLSVPYKLIFKTRSVVLQHGKLIWELLFHWRSVRLLEKHKWPLDSNTIVCQKKEGSVRICLIAHLLMLDFSSIVFKYYLIRLFRITKINRLIKNVFCNVNVHVDF